MAADSVTNELKRPDLGTSVVVDDQPHQPQMAEEIYETPPDVQG